MTDYDKEECVAMLARLERGTQKLPNGCWEWHEGRNGAGYGMVWWRNKKVSVHRFGWAATHGVDPTGHVCHRCDNPPCWNPAHLFVGDDAANLRDMTAKGRSCGRFTDSDVILIRRACDAGATYASLAARYGVSYQTISNIDKGRRYRHVGR